MIKVSTLIPHVGNRPFENSTSQSHVSVVKVLQGQKRDDALGDTVNINGIRAIMIILRRSVLPEKMVLVEFKSSLHMGLKIRCFGASRDGPQGTQIETCVEIVLPSLRWRLPVIPRTVLVLLAHREAHRLQRRP